MNVGSEEDDQMNVDAEPDDQMNVDAEPGDQMNVDASSGQADDRMSVDSGAARDLAEINQYRGGEERIETAVHRCAPISRNDVPRSKRPCRGRGL